MTAELFYPGNYTRIPLKISVEYLLTPTAAWQYFDLSFIEKKIESILKDLEGYENPEDRIKEIFRKKGVVGKPYGIGIIKKAYDYWDNILKNKPLREAKEVAKKYIQELEEYFLCEPEERWKIDADMEATRGILIPSAFRLSGEVRKEESFQDYFTLKKLEAQKYKKLAEEACEDISRYVKEIFEVYRKDEEFGKVFKFVKKRKEIPQSVVEKINAHIAASGEWLVKAYWLKRILDVLDLKENTEEKLKEVYGIRVVNSNGLRGISNPRKLFYGEALERERKMFEWLNVFI